MTETRTSLKQQGAAGNTVIVRASALAEAGTKGIVAKGILEKTEPNKFNAANNDYFIRGTDGTLFILNDTASLRAQLGQPGVIGMKLEVVYNGKKESKKKGGKAYHDFEVFSLESKTA